MPPNLPRFSQSLWLVLTVFIVFAVTFVLYVRSEKKIDYANELRSRSFLLADELRQSSDDLSRMARSYVLTGDSLYKQHFQEILAIRDGNKARPIDYYTNIYWDLVLSDDKRPYANGRAIALLDLMRQTGFTEAELTKLAQAKASSDVLTTTEYAAMHLLESLPAISASKRLEVSLMLHDKAYQQAKANIMYPISEFYQMMNQRTLNTVQTAENNSVILRAVFVCFGLLLIMSLERAYRALYITLGCSVETLHSSIMRLGSGDFSNPIHITEKTKDSVMAWLLETQLKLAQLDAERNESQAKNQRLTQLYAALSQCNQAIVRCNNQHDLFKQICRDAVLFGGMKMAWIGLLDQSTQRLMPIAYYGEGTDYLDGIEISIDGAIAAGQGPTGTAMREDCPFWCQDFQHDKATAPWHERGANYNWRASAALPLHQNNQVIGTFTFYSAELNAFDEAARNLLVEMAIDIDYALNNFAHEAQRKQAETALANSHQLLTTVINTAPMRIFWKDTQLRYLGANIAFAKDAGLSNSADLIGKDDYQLEWKENADIYRADDQEVINLGISKLSYEEPQTNTEGNTIWLRTSKVPFYNEQHEIIGILGIYDDITEQKKAQEHIDYLANFDVLTGLPNRVQLDIRINYAINLAKRAKSQLALLFLDLDHFKDINDTFGHSMGDTLLIAFAKRLCSVLREEDTLTRLGGDEFIILLPNINADGAARVANKLLMAIAQPYKIEQYDMSLTASIGIALYPDDGIDLESLSKSADMAMYRVKREGRHGFNFFTKAMQQHTTRNLQLLNGLRQALQHQQLQVCYQAQVNLQSQQLIGAEVLLRWQHPQLGVISPAEFIPIAEDSGLILSIGEWVLRTAVQQAKSWLNKGYAPFIIAVNLSAVQFRHIDLPHLISRILHEEELPPQYLELELTESIALHNPKGAIAIINDLHQRGIRLSIDDFGTGYSSLSYLKKFKVYKLKIDQSFVRDISTDLEDKAIVSATINLAKSLGLKTIAEGVETQEQLAFLKAQGCDEAQGYLFSKPLSAIDFETLLQQHAIGFNY
ncbi:MAG: EAL domain-containing protein [Methylococcaceae bacterium]